MRQIIVSLTIAIFLVFFAVGLLVFRTQEKAPDPDIDFVNLLSTWCAEFAREDPRLSLEDLLVRVYERGAESKYAERFVPFTLVLDAQDKPLRHSMRRGGLEWRSAGRDGVFYSADDIVSAYRLGDEKVLP